MIKQSSYLIAIIILIIGIPQILTAGFDEDFYFKTLRFDFIHTGNHESGRITPDRFIEEPYWGGSKVNLKDTFGYGRYFFEVKDTNNVRVLFSRGFSSLFVEWQDTEEAHITEKSYRESIVMPYPRIPVKIIIYQKDKQNRLKEYFRIVFNPVKDAVTLKVPLSFPVADILINGPTDKNLDVLFIAEGYTAAEREKFLRDCTRFAGYLLGATPFKDNISCINIRGIQAESEESGVSVPGENIFRNTVLGVSFYTFGSERYLMAEDFQRVRDVAALAPYDQIFIIANSDKYGGGGIYNFYSTGTSDSKSADFLLIHEFGHSFAGLGDEYYTSEVAVSDFYDLKTEPWEPNITTLIDFGSKWQDLVKPGTPVPTPAKAEFRGVVGVFEGGGYLEKGIYRPYIDCTMKSIRYDSFCPICRRAITRMISYYSE